MTQKHVLLELVKDCKNGIEIGTLLGDTVLYLLENLPNLKMTTIDPNPEITLESPNVQKVINRLTIISRPSDDAVKNLTGEYDFVWIDGDHSFEQVIKDIDNYMPLVKSGGILGGHDYGSQSCEGVQGAVDLRFRDKINLGEDLTWWVIKGES